jgi:hypothetical protein
MGLLDDLKQQAMRATRGSSLMTPAQPQPPQPGTDHVGDPTKGCVGNLKSILKR